MTKEEIQIAQAAYCVGKMWDEYEGTEDFDLLVGKRVQHLIELVRKSNPSLPSNLDEAAEKEIDRFCSDMLNVDIIWAGMPLTKRFGLQMAKFGAEWMAGQFKTLGETEIYLEDDGGEEPYTQEWLDLAATEFAIPEGFKPGDKVVVQIRKK